MNKHSENHVEVASKLCRTAVVERCLERLSLAGGLGRIVCGLHGLEQLVTSGSIVCRRSSRECFVGTTLSLCAQGIRGAHKRLLALT